MSNVLLKEAVHAHAVVSKQGVLERMFTLAFRGFVYPQIWEDPEFDMEAPDWKPIAQLTTLGSEITRTGRPGARVIFRTAGADSPLPGSVPDRILDQWYYDGEACRTMAARDRSSIYGGFHLYRLAN